MRLVRTIAPSLLALHAMCLALVASGCATAPSAGVSPAPISTGASIAASQDSPPRKGIDSRALFPPSRPVAAPVAAQTSSAPEGPATAPSGTREAARLSSNLVERIRAGFAMPELPSALVDAHVRRYVANPAYLTRNFERGGRYLHHIVEEVEARGLPTELALLPIVESAFNPQATSRAQAAGLWQFIPSTGRNFKLDQNWWTDERRDVIESTRAALDYLEKIYALNDRDWFLALASYNWGEGAVGRAVRSNRAKGLPTDYASLKMPRETRNYVPKLIALRNILRDPQAYGLSLPFVENKPFFAAIDRNQSIDLALAARFAELPIEEFRALNPHLHRPVIAVSRSNRIILPLDAVEAYNRNLGAHVAAGRALVSWHPYTLKAGENLASVAKRAGITPERLAQANSLKSSKQALLPGTSLLVPVETPRHSTEVESALARFAGAKTVERVVVPAKTYRVKKKDTLARIAARFGVSESTLRALNHLSGEVKAGMRLTIAPAQTKTLVTDAQGRSSFERPPPTANKDQKKKRESRAP